MASIVTSSLTPMQRVVRMVGQYRREVRYVLLYAAVAGLINLSLPLGVQAIISLVQGGAISASWGVLVLFIIVGAMLTGIMRLMQLAIMENLQRRIFADAAAEFALRIPRLNMELLRREHLPEMINRFFDTLTIQKTLPKLIIDGITAILTIIFSLLLLSVYHVTFVIFSLVLIITIGLLMRWMGPRGLETSLTESKYKYKLVFWLEEVARVATTFKLAGENRFPVKRADALAINYLEARAKHWKVLMAFFIGSVVFRVIVLAGFLILGSILVMNNDINIGAFVAAEILVLFVVDSTTKLIELYETGYDLLTATEKIGQVADLPMERDGGIKVDEFCQGQAFSVELRDLSYQYDDGQYPVLKNINLKIESGERVAVTGHNASGKSTLMQVISVLKRDYTGSLLYNGLPKQNINLRSLRHHIGDMSSQEDIFMGTLLENITLGRGDVSLVDVFKTTEAVGLQEFIQELPQGVDTPLLPGGKNLPGNVITKILVCRALVTSPKMLAMEEPLGNLNFRDRVRIAKLLTDKINPWTLVAVTEDPLLASMCDRVIVLREGSLVFDGTFDEVQRTEYYDRIFRSSPEFSTEKIY